jgi:hypothetical protein
VNGPRFSISMRMVRIFDPLNSELRVTLASVFGLSPGHSRKGRDGPDTFVCHQLGFQPDWAPHLSSAVVGNRAWMDKSIFRIRSCAAGGTFTAVACLGFDAST